MRAVPLAALLIKMDSQKSQIHTHTQANRKRERERNRDSHRETVVLSVDGDAVGPSVDCCRQPFMHSLTYSTHTLVHSLVHSFSSSICPTVPLSVCHALSQSLKQSIVAQLLLAWKMKLISGRSSFSAAVNVAVAVAARFHSNQLENLHLATSGNKSISESVKTN